jgi:murein L,D-transpeptidase YcbB/YkuD
MWRMLPLLFLIAGLPVHAQEWDFPSAKAMLAAMDHAATHGLPPERYGRAALADAVTRGDLASAAGRAEAGFRLLAADLLTGASPARARKAWYLPRPANPEAAVERALGRARATGDFAGAVDGLAPSHPSYAALRQALQQQPTESGGHRDSIIASLERWRWMPRSLGGRHLWVNVPAFEATLLDPPRGTVVTRVIVGKRQTPTPQFAAMVSGVILNPEWVVPKSIQAEGIARMLATDPKGAAAKGYRRTATGITQGPGPYNQLGQVKLSMPNPYSVYLHDTPAKTLFERKVRALSHGCIRTQNILGLAERLLADTSGWDREALDAAVAAGRTVEIPLAQPVPVYIVYFTAEPDGAGGLRVHPDLYGRDTPIQAALRANAAASAAEATGKQQSAGTECGQDLVELADREGEATMASADLAMAAGD